MSASCETDICESPLDAFVNFIASLVNWLASDIKHFAVFMLALLIFAILVAYNRGIDKGKKSAKSEIKIPVKSEYEVEKIEIKEK